MKIKSHRWPVLTCLVVATWLVVVLFSRELFSADQSENDQSAFSPYVSDDGAISRPTDFREKFTFLGTFADATKGDESIDEIHNVYSRPEDVQTYLKDGKFADGAVLIKEVCGSDNANLTTGKAHWSTDTKLWFVMVKDSKGRFPKNELWGDGWGWALFYADKPTENVATDYATDCRTCHLPAKKDDWLYIRGYPLLRDHAAK